MSGQGNQMSKEDAARIQSTQAKGDKDMSSTGFAARAQSAGDKNANAAGTKRRTIGPSKSTYVDLSLGQGGAAAGSGQGNATAGQNTPKK